jgi:hypothetical protein
MRYLEDVLHQSRYRLGRRLLANRNWLVIDGKKSDEFDGNPMIDAPHQQCPLTDYSVLNLLSAIV